MSRATVALGPAPAGHMYPTLVMISRERQHRERPTSLLGEDLEGPVRRTHLVNQGSELSAGGGRRAHRAGLNSRPGGQACK